MKPYASDAFIPQYPTSDTSTISPYQGGLTPGLVDPFKPLDYNPLEVLKSDAPPEEKRIKIAEALIRSGVPNEEVNVVLKNMEADGTLESGSPIPTPPPINLEYSNDASPDYFNQFKPGGTAPKPPPAAAAPKADSSQPPPALKGNQDTELLPKIQPKKLSPTQLQQIQQKLMQQKPLTPDEQDALRSHRAAQPKKEEPKSMGKIVTEEVQNLGIGVSNMGKTLKSGFADWLVGSAARGLYGADTLSQLGIDTDLVDDEYLYKMREWGEGMRPMMADDRITAIGYKMFHNQPLTKEEEALIAEYRDDQLTPFVGGGENAMLGEFIQTLPSSVPALTQGLVFGIVGSLAGGPMAGGRAGAMVGSQDAAASQNTGSALAELDLLRKGSNLALDPKRAAIQTKLRRLYPMQDDWDKAFAKMEAIVVHEVSDNRLMPLRKTSKETADFVYDGQGYSVNLASIADAASLYTFSAASLPEYLGKNIAWDAGMEGITGFMDYKAVRDAMQTALLEVGMGEITPEEAHLWSNEEAVKSAVMEAAAGATISTGITYGQYALSGSQEMQEQFETNRQMRLGKKIAKGAEARQAQEESLAAYIKMQEEKANANPDLTLQGKGLLDELYEQPSSPGNLLDPNYNASTGITEKEDTVPSSSVEKRTLTEQFQDSKRDESQDANILGGEAILQDAKEAIPSVQDPAQQTGPTKAQRQEFKKQVAKGRAEIVANPGTLLYAIKLLGRSNKSLKERFEQGKIKVVSTVEEAKAANKGLFVHEMAEAVFDPNTETTTFIASNISNQSLAERKGFPKKPAIEWPEIGQIGGGTKLSPLERMAIRAIEVMEHEYVGHQGLRDYMSEDQRNSLMERTYSNFHEEIDQYRAKVNPSLNDADATEEWIVNKYAEKGVLKQTWMSRLQNKLAERKGQTRSVNDMEIRSFFEDVVKQQKKGAPKPAVPETPAAPAAPKKEAAPASKLTPKEEQLKAAQNNPKPKPAPKPKEETKPPPAAPPVPKAAPKPGRDLDWEAMPDKDEATIDDSGILGQEEVVAPEPEKPVDPEEIKIPPLKPQTQLDSGESVEEDDILEDYGGRTYIVDKVNDDGTADLIATETGLVLKKQGVRDKKMLIKDSEIIEEMPEATASKQAPPPPINPPEPAAAPETTTPTAEKPKRVVAPKVKKPKIPPIPDNPETGLTKSTVVQETKKLYEYVGKIESGEMAHPTSKESDRLRIEQSKKRIERYTGLPFEQTPIVLEEWISQLPKKLQDEIRGTDETLEPTAAPETTAIEPGPIADVPDTTDSPVEPDETDYVAWYNKMRKGQREVLSQKFLSEKGNATKVSKAIAATTKWEKLDERQRQRIRELTRGEVPIAAKMPKPTTTLQNVDPSPPLGDASAIPTEREPQAPEPDGSVTLVDAQKREMEEIKRQGGDPSTVPVPAPVVEDTELPKAVDSGNDPIASTIKKDNQIVRFAPPPKPILKDRRGADEIALPKQPDQKKSAVHDGNLRVTGGLEEGKISDAGRLARTLEDVGYDNPHEPVKFLGPVLVKAFTEKYAAVLPNIRLHSNPEWAGGHFNGGVGISLDVARNSNPEQLAFTLLHEIGHATHSLLGDQINKLPNITEELAAIENLLYPNLRQLITDKVAADEASVDGRFFNYLLSPEELIANYNVFIAANPEHMKVAPQISEQLQGEVLNRLDEMVVVRNAMPTGLFGTTLAVGGLNEDLSINMFPPSEAWRKTPQYENAIIDQVGHGLNPERTVQMMELAKQVTTNEAKDNLAFRLYLAAMDYEDSRALPAIEKAIELAKDNPRTSDHWRQAKEKRRQEIIDYASAKNKKEKESQKKPESPASSYADDFDVEKLKHVYSNQSQNPEGRVKNDIAEYVATIEKYKAKLEKEGVAEPELTEQVERFREKYRTKYNAVHAAESRVASAFVVGPAKFPTARNQKRVDTAEKRRGELYDFVNKYMKPKREDTAIRSGTATAAQQLEDKIGKLEDKQKRMKDANRILRKFSKSGVDGKDHPGFRDYYNAMKTVDPEITEEVANTMISHKDAFGNIGYAPYELTNNNAEIRRAKERLVQEKRRAEEDAQVTEDQKTEDGDLVLRDNGEAQVVVNKELNRVQLKTPEKPAAALIQRLKSRGFRWSPKNQAWQRQDTEDARRILSEIYDDAYPDGDNVADIPTEAMEPATVATEPKEEAPVAAAPEEKPEPMTRPELQEQLLKRFGNDPLYAAVINAQTPEEAKVAIESLTSVRGASAMDAMKKFTANYEKTRTANPKPKKKQDTGTTHGKIVKVVEDLMPYEEQLVEFEGEQFELFPQVNRSLGWAAAVLRNTDGEDVHRIGGMPGDEGLKHQLGILNRFLKDLKANYVLMEGSEEAAAGPMLKPPEGYEDNRVLASEPLPAVARDAYAYGMTATIPKEIAAIADTESKLAVLPVSDLIISHDMMGVPNPDYTAITKEGQPRNRTNLDNDNKLQDIITNPDVLKLTDNSPQIGKGIPIVGREGVVLSGNNRSRALKYMAEEIKEQRQGFWSDYLARIRVPSLYGFSDVELRQAFEEIEADGGTPVLVRQFTEPLSEKQMREIGVLENQDDTEVMGPGERAKLLGDKLTSSDLAVLTREGEGIYLKNKTVVERLGSRLGTPAELKTYVDPQTRTLTNAGETAVEAAILYKAYGQQVAERYVNDPAPPPSYKALVRVAHEKLQTDAMVDQLSGVNEERSEFLKSLDITDEYLAAYEQYTNNPQIRNLPDLLSDWRNLEEVVAFTEETRPVAILAKAQWGNGREATIKSLVGKLQAWYQSMQGWSEPLNEQVPESKVDALEQIFGDPNYTAMQDSLFSLRRPADVTSWFSGGGTMEAALGGLTQTVGAVEYNAAILEHYNKVHGTDFKPKDIRAVSPLDVMEENPTLYHASPVCCNFSKAKTMRGADEADRQTVEQLVDVITIAQPPIVTIENVPAYAQTELATAITDALTAAGYKHETIVMDSADLGGIQQRKRMLIRGVLEGELPTRPEKQPAGDWYAALEDLIDDAPASEFRSKDGKENWELKRIRQMAERGSIDPTLPIITMGGSAGHSVANARNAGGPAPTLKATSKEVARIIMPDGRVKRVTPRMMARLMGLPDSYKVPDNPELAKTILGNGMEANFTQQLIGPLLSRETGKFSLRQKPPPQKTVIAYKLFDIKKDGKLYPKYILADKPFDIGVWYDAEMGPPDPKNPRKVKAKLSGGLAPRPGLHGAFSPTASHIGEGGQPPTTRRAKEVWAEVEIADDVDWQTEANSRAIQYKRDDPKGRYKKGDTNWATAEIRDELPVDGHYRFRTNANVKDDWFIAGAMKINRILSDEEVIQINKQNNATPDLPRREPRLDSQLETPKFSLIPDIPRSVNLQARADKDPASLGGANIVHSENFPSLQEHDAFFESALGSYIKEWRRSKPPTRDQFPNEKKYLKAHQRYRQEEIHEGLTTDQAYDRMIQIAKRRGSRQSEMEVQTLFGNKDHFKQMVQQAGSVFDAMVQPQIPQLVISKIQQNLQYPRLHYAAGENHVTGSERVITISHDNMDVYQPFPREPKKSHYGSENEIGFLMVHDREDFKDVPYGETGDRILQLDQIQSDLINEIRKKGVRTKTDEELVELRDAKAYAEAEPEVRQRQLIRDLEKIYTELGKELPPDTLPTLVDLELAANKNLIKTTTAYIDKIRRELDGVMFTFGRNRFPELNSRLTEVNDQYAADQEQNFAAAEAAQKTYRQESNAQPDHFLRDTYYRRFLEFFVQLAIEEDYNGFVLPTANQVMTANRTDEDKRAGNELYYDRRYPSHVEKYINYLNENQGTGIELTREDFNNMGEMMLVGRFQSSTRAERNDSRQAIRSFKPSLFSLKNNDPNQKPKDTDENTKNQIMNRHLGLPSMRNAFNKTKLLKQVNRIARGVSGFVDPFAYIAHRDQLLTNRNLAKGEIQRIERIQREIYNAVRELPQERQQELYAYLTEGQEDYFLENESDRALGRRIRDTINDLGQQLVDMGHIPQESYDNYKDRYLPQIYLKYLLPDETLNLLSTGRKPSPMGYTKQRILTGEKSTDLLIQEILGIIRDPAFLAAQSIGTVGRDLALHRYFEKIADNPKWALEDQFVGFSLHDEFAVSVMEMAEDPNIEFSKEAAEEMLTRLRIHELEEMPVPSYSRADLKEFDDFINAISGGYNEKVKLERSEPGASEEDGPGPDETEAMAWRYFRAAFTRFKNELAKSDDKRPYLNVRKLKNSAKHLSNILMSALDERWGSESLSVKQQAAGENVGLNMDTSDIEAMLSIVEPYLNMRGESVTASYLADELRRIREQIAPNKQAEYQKAIYKLTERMNFYVKDAYEKTGLDLDAENPEPTQGWARMPKDKRYGALRGMWVKKEIYDDTVGFTQLEPHMDWAQKYLFGDNSVANVYNRYKKLTSVALNPPSMARNFISNKIWMWLVTGMPIFPLLHGNNPMNSSLPYTFRAIRALGLKDSNHPDYKYKELFEKYGLGVGTFSNQELRRIRNEVADFELRLKVHERALSKEEKQQLSEETGIPLEEFKDFSAAKIYGLWLSNLWHRYVVDKGGFVYQQMEFMDKLAVVIYAMEQKGVTEEEAVRLAEDALFDYSLVKPWVRTIRTSPMGSPFFTYTAKILETYPRAVKRDPKGVLRRTLQLLAWQYKGFDWLGRIIQMGLGETIKEMYDEEETVTDELKKYLGKFAEENMSMSLWPFKDSKDRFQLMDWQYYIPWGQYTKAAELFAQGKFTDAVGGFGLYNTFFFSLVFGYQTGVDPFTGRMFIDSNLPPEHQKVQKQIWALNQVVPAATAGMFEEIPKMISGLDVPTPQSSGVIRNLLDAAAQEGYLGEWFGESSAVDNRGQPRRTLGQSAGRFLFGSNLYSVDPEYHQDKQALTDQYNLSRTKGQLKTQLRAVESNTSLSEEEKREQSYKIEKYFLETLMQQQLEMLRKQEPISEELLRQ